MHLKPNKKMYLDFPALMASAYPIPFGKHLRGIKDDGCAVFAGDKFWSDGFLSTE